MNFGGFLGWWVWLFIHIGFLTGYRNRVGAILGWWFAFVRDIRRERAFTLDDMPLESPRVRRAARVRDLRKPGPVTPPLRHFADRLEEVRSAKILDMDQVGRALVELAADEEFFGPLIARLPPARPAASG